MVRRRRDDRRARHLLSAAVLRALTLFSAVSLRLVLAAGAAHADKEAGVDATLGVPLAPWSNAVGPGYGGSLWLRVPAGELVDVTLRVGAMVHGDQPVPGTMAHQRLSEIPLLGGARWRAFDGPLRIYFSGEVGLVWARTDLDLGSVDDSDAPIRLASFLGVDVEYDRFIVRGGVWLADLSALDHAIGATVSIGARVVTW